MKQESLQKAGQPAAEVEKKRDHTELMANIENKCAASFGLRDGKVAFQILTQAANLQCWSGSEKALDNFGTALGTLSEIGPRGALEKWAFAIDVETGRQIWRTPVRLESGVRRAAFHRGAATIYNGKLFRVTIDNHVLALDMKTGIIFVPSRK